MFFSNKLRLATLVFTFILLVTSLGNVYAVTDGQPDGNGHPYVGLLLFEVNGVPSWRCSGTLISPTVVLTAGHCTSGATGGRVWFDADVTKAAIPQYPYASPSSVEFASIHTHPAYPTASFVVNDVGVVILAQAVNMPTYGVLPSLNQLDELASRRGQQDVTFTAVGYGLQASFPDAASWQTQAFRIRMVANPTLIQINVPGFTGDFSLLLSNNSNTGGTCFGDSGGPNFLGSSNVIAGVTSFGINGNCAGTGGVFRMDRANALNFVLPFLGN